MASSSHGSALSVRPSLTRSGVEALCSGGMTGPGVNATAPGTHLAEPEAARHRDGRQLLGELWAAVAKRPIGIAAPAPGPTVQSLGAGVKRAGGGASEAQPARDRTRPEAQRGLSVSDLTGSTIAPAVRTVLRRNRAGVVAARVNLPEQVSAHHLDGPRAAELRRAVSELTILVVTPAIDAVCRGYAAGVGSAGADLQEPQAAQYQNRREPRGEGAVAQLTARVRAPAVQLIVGIGDAAGKMEARVHLPKQMSPPAPSWPDALYPQHQAALSVVHGAGVLATAAHLIERQRRGRQGRRACRERLAPPGTWDRSRTLPVSKP